MNIKETTVKIASKVYFWFKKNAPELLVASGILTGAASIFLACKATTKLEKKITPINKRIEKIHSDMKNDDLIRNDQYSVSQGKKDLAKEYAKAAWELVKLYGPTAISFSLSIASVLASHKMMKGRNLALAAAYTTVDGAFKSYRERVKEKLGEKIEDDIYHNITKEKIEVEETDEDGKVKSKKVPCSIKSPNSDYAYLFDASNRNWENNGGLNIEWLLTTERYMNQKLRVQGYLFLSDVYEALGVEAGHLGERALQASKVVGWLYIPDDPERDSYVSFGLADKMGNLNEYAMDMKRYGERDIWLEFNVDGDILTGNNGQKTFMKYCKSI